jgi:NhaA family Na+:H+ antiporter
MNRFVKKAVNPLKFFISDSRSIGVLLLLCTAFSLFMSNTSGGGWYRAIWSADVSPILNLPHSPLKWINDFLMAIFFLLAGMEIKRELTSGELSSFKRAILPFGAALGGMVVPALIFMFLNTGTAFTHGWGIPTATDIAFSLGIASLFGKRVPTNLKIFLMALAIIDDLGAIIVIALFYGGKVQGIFFIMAAILYALLWLCNYVKLKPGFIQLTLAVLLWYAILNAGIEASITGVLVAFAMPVNSLPKLEKIIHGGVNFFILPLFALSNTAVLVPGDISVSLNNTIALGVIAGLVIGKPVGIFLFSRILVALGIAKMPGHVYWKQFLGMGTLAGIGFTMSIFTTTLAFNGEVQRDIAKIAVLTSMILSLAISWIYFLILGQTATHKSTIRSADAKVIDGEIVLG